MSVFPSRYRLWRS